MRLLDEDACSLLETDLRVRLTLGGTDLDLAIENLFDSSRDIFAYGNPLRFSSGRQYTPQRPLTGRISIRRRF